MAKGPSCSVRLRCVGVTAEAANQYPRPGVVHRPVRDAEPVAVRPAWWRDDPHPAAQAAIELPARCTGGTERGYDGSRVSAPGGPRPTTGCPPVCHAESGSRATCEPGRGRLSLLPPRRACDRGVEPRAAPPAARRKAVGAMELPLVTVVADGARVSLPAVDRTVPGAAGHRRPWVRCRRGAPAVGGQPPAQPAAEPVGGAARAPRPSRAGCPVTLVRGDKPGVAGTQQRILPDAGEPSSGGEAAVRFAPPETAARADAPDAARAPCRPAHGGADPPVRPPHPTDHPAAPAPQQE